MSARLRWVRPPTGRATGEHDAAAPTCRSQPEGLAGCRPRGHRRRGHRQPGGRARRRHGSRDSCGSGQSDPRGESATGLECLGHERSDRDGRGRANQGICLSAQREQGSEHRVQGQRQAGADLHDRRLPHRVVRRARRTADAACRPAQRDDTSDVPEERDNRPDRMHLERQLCPGDAGHVDQRYLPGGPEERGAVPELHHLYGARRLPCRTAALPAAGHDVSGLQRLSERQPERQEPVRLQQLRPNDDRRNQGRRQGLVRPALHGQRHRRGLLLVGDQLHPLDGTFRLRRFLHDQYRDPHQRQPHPELSRVHLVGTRRILVETHVRCGRGRAGCGDQSRLLRRQLRLHTDPF